MMRPTSPSRHQTASPDFHTGAIGNLSRPRVIRRRTKWDVRCPALALTGTAKIEYLLWQANHDRVHLEQAKSLLDEELAKVPGEFHEAMCTNLRVNREILAAWRDP